MQAKGGTNIMEGVMWGWRVLSPEPPFTEGKAYDDPENDKFLIVMTDGENWHQSRSNHNKSTLSRVRLWIEGPARQDVHDVRAH